MSFHRIKRKSARFWESYRIVFYTVIGVCALGWLYYFLANIGPRSVGSGRSAAVQDVRSDDSTIRDLIEEVDRLDKIHARADAAGLATTEALEALEQAVAKQRELLRLYPKGNYEQGVRLTELETRLDSARAAVIVTRIEQLQKDGEAALKEGQVEVAGRLLGEGLALQRQVNGSNASSRYKNYVRETALAQAIAAIDATPVYREKEAALRAARDALAEERWEDALAAFTRARDLQGHLNREYARTRYADIAAYDRLESEIASLNAAGVAAEVDAKEAAGDTAVKAGEHARGATLYGEAFARQQEINREYARSRFVSSARLDRLEVKRQTALARPLVDRLTEMDRRIAGDLAARRVVAAEQRIPEAVALIDRVTTDYPKNDFRAGALRIKLSYLSLKRNDLRTMQDEAYANLLPLPGTSGVLLYKTEVPQRLYALVMNTNPSRNPGRAWPVDSVNWSDAGEFCTRMGWVLGSEVRLPTADEFRVALGDDFGRLVGADSGDARTQAVSTDGANANGFHDLLGNAAEWLHAADDGSTAPVIGGSYLDPAATLRTIPVENRARNDRARHIGFRFVLVRPE